MRDPAPNRRAGSAWMSGRRRLCFNTVEAEAKGLPKPATWADLTKPEYKGQIVMPNPASSGTGYLMVSAWLQLMGEEKGWAYMDALHQNIAAYTHSGSKPCKQAARRRIRDRPLVRVPRQQDQADGAPIDVVLPSEGLGWDMEATGIIERRPRTPMPPRSWSTGRSTRRPTSFMPRTMPSSRMPGVAAKLEFVPGRHRGDADQERLRLGRREPRPHSRRVVEALRRASPSRRAEASAAGLRRRGPPGEAESALPQVRERCARRAHRAPAALSARPRAVASGSAPFTALENIDLDI